MTDILKKMSILLLVSAVTGICGCGKKTESFDPSQERSLRSLTFRNHSSEKVFVKNIDLALEKKCGGNVIGNGELVFSSPPRGPLPSKLDIYWEYANRYHRWNRGNKKYHKRVKIKLPIIDKRVFDGVTVNFDKDKCWLTYSYVFGDIVRENSAKLDLDEEGYLTDYMCYKITIDTYHDKSRVGESFRKVIRDYEANKRQEKISAVSEEKDSKQPEDSQPSFGFGGFSQFGSEKKDAKDINSQPKDRNHERNE